MIGKGRGSMIFTLEQQMDSLFHHGIMIMQKNKSSIQKQWEQFQQYLHKSGKKSAITMLKSVEILSDSIFERQYEKEALIYHIKNEWYSEIGKLPINQFIITMLENSVYRATKIKSSQNYRDYQAIQYVFTKIGEHILTDKLEDLFTVDSFLEHLVMSRQLPIDWVAVVLREEQTYYVEKWFDKNQCLLHKKEDIFALNIYDLTEQILTYITHSNNKNVLTIPFENITLLLCADREYTHFIIPFINHALQLLQSGKTTLNITRQEQQWKDSVIMFQESLLRARNFEDALKQVTEGFVNYLPFKRCAIFSYSSNDEIGIGLSGSRFNSKEIKSITEDVRNLPLLDNGLELLRLFGKGMKFLQPLHISDATDSFPAHYIQQFQLKSVVVAPIFKDTNNELIGAAFLDQGENESFSITQDTYTALIKFGQSAGEILGKFKQDEEPSHGELQFSSREIEVLQLMAKGESTTSAAAILHLSEYTVRDYIAATMQKMGVKNRTEAVARAIRSGII